MGYLFQGRFKAIVVDRDAYLLTLCRYGERNPVAAGIVSEAQAWPWSSCRAHLGQVPAPPWLDTDGLHGYLLGRPVVSAADRSSAVARYAELLLQETDGDLWARGLRQQVFLGDEAFVNRLLEAHPSSNPGSVEVSRRQRSRPTHWPDLLAESATREQALHAAYTQHGFTMTQLARYTGLSVSLVSRLIAGCEGRSRAAAAG